MFSRVRQARYVVVVLLSCGEKRIIWFGVDAVKSSSAASHYEQASTFLSLYSNASIWNEVVTGLGRVLLLLEWFSRLSGDLRFLHSFTFLHVGPTKRDSNLFSQAIFILSRMTKVSFLHGHLNILITLKCQIGHLRVCKCENNFIILFT